MLLVNGFCGRYDCDRIAFTQNGNRFIHSIKVMINIRDEVKK
jgi:hypothetical protein